MVKAIKQTFPPREGDYITTIQILNSTRLRLKGSSRKDQTYDDKINELLDLEASQKKWCHKCLSKRDVEQCPASV